MPTWKPPTCLFTCWFSGTADRILIKFGHCNSLFLFIKNSIWFNPSLPALLYCVIMTVYKGAVSLKPLFPGKDSEFKPQDHWRVNSRSCSSLQHLCELFYSYKFIIVTLKCWMHSNSLFSYIIVVCDWVVSNGIKFLAINCVKPLWSLCIYP